MASSTYGASMLGKSTLDNMGTSKQVSVEQGASLNRSVDGMS
jgi:hypothetical protein